MNEADALAVVAGVIKPPEPEEQPMLDYERFGACNLCAGPVRRHRKTKEVHCARCGALPHEPTVHGPVVLMQRRPKEHQ